MLDAMFLRRWARGFRERAEWNDDAAMSNWLAALAERYDAMAADAEKRFAPCSANPG
jgi:hypothetical protein